jgi:hypothetical protein
MGYSSNFLAQSNHCPVTIRAESGWLRRAASSTAPQAAFSIQTLPLSAYVTDYRHFSELNRIITTINTNLKKQKTVASVRKQTIPTDRPPLVGEVSANFLRREGATWSAGRIPTAVFSAL